jgi:hypothetical protein
MTMINFRNITAALVLGLAVAAAASPAFAKSRSVHPGHDARAQAIQSDVGEGLLTPEREKALRDCNALAGGFRNYTWGVTQSAELRACMAERGQPE